MRYLTAAGILHPGWSGKSRQRMMPGFRKRLSDATMTSWRIAAIMKGTCMIKHPSEPHNCKTVWFGGRPDLPDWRKPEPIKLTGPTVPAKPGKPAKICSFCGASYGKSPNESLRVFSLRKFCSNACLRQRQELQTAQRLEQVKARLPATSVELGKSLGLSLSQIKPLLTTLLEQGEIETVSFKEQSRVYQLVL